MASIFTPTSNNLSGPWNINREDCIGDSLGYINANSNYFGLKINTLDTKIDNIFSIGMIMMWSGSIVNIPIGWDLCDGQNGTPDLRDRFIVGAGNTHAVGATGGANTVTLTTNQIPAHSHPFSDYYQLTTVTRPADNVGFEKPPFAGGAVNGVTETGLTTPNNTGNAGAGQAHENRPPFYALAFIIKV